MRRLDDTPIDPEIAAALDAIDATLAGEPVDPRHAELAELALLVADERPEPDAECAAELDHRVEGRFARPPASPKRRSRWLWGPAAGLAAAAVVVVVIVSQGPPAKRAASDAALPASTSAAASGASRVYKVPIPQGAQTLSTPSGASSSGDAIPAPPPNAHKVVQGAQLSLTTPASRIDTVAQEVFDVVGQEKGTVSSSTVTAGGTSGYAQFELSVPSASLPQTMAALSTVRYARVASRTDTTQDVNGQYLADVRRLADARALRTSLLKQLANATTQTQIESLTARIHDAEASISSDEATLRQLNHQVDLTQIALTINAGAVPVAGSHGGGFTLGNAAHDAGKVLTVAAGIALIIAAALVPVGLVAALGWWIAAAVRRRRREQALDSI